MRDPICNFLWSICIWPLHKGISRIWHSLFREVVVSNACNFKIFIYFKLFGIDLTLIHRCSLLDELSLKKYEIVAREVSDIIFYMYKFL